VRLATRFQKPPTFLLGSGFAGLGDTYPKEKSAFLHGWQGVVPSGKGASRVPLKPRGRFEGARFVAGTQRLPSDGVQHGWLRLRSDCHSSL